MKAWTMIVRWIPVDERKPNCRGVWIARKDGSVQAGEFCHSSLEEYGGHFYMSDEGGIPLDEVTHWAPFEKPDPPTKEG
jgi:hypothetical protein